MNYSNLMEAVNARIKANGRREITGDILNDVLRAMVVELGAGYQLGGTIRPGDKPKVEDLRVAYLAVEPGMYLYAGGFEVTELSLITYGAEWYMYPLGVPFGSQIAEDIAAAVDAEKTRAMSAEEALNDAIAAEASARKAADNALTTKIETEVSDRKAADQTLQGNINAEKTRAMSAEKALSDAIATEAREREAADSALDSAIKAETKRATDAEGVLAKAVEDEKARAMAAEGANASAITAEADARAKADTTLQGNITAEATAREAADDALAAKITAEETARKAADATLQSNIDKKVSKDDDTWLENFMPRIILNKNGSVQSVTVGDNVAANYATISARLSRYGGVVIGTTIYQDNTPKGRVVQVHSRQGQSFPNVLYVTAIYNYGEHFTEEFANSKYEIVLNYNSEGEFVSGTYEFRPICEVFEIELDGRSSSELDIDKTYDDFNHFRESLTGYKSTPLIILNDNWTRSKFILTRYYSHGYGSSNDYHWVYELSFISIKDKQLVGYYIVVEKDKTTVTPFEFQAQTQEEIDAATNKMTELEGNVMVINDNFQGMAEYLQPIIEGLETGKQDTISDLATIRTNAANGQTAFSWGDHAKAGYSKAFIINISGDGSTENPYAVDKTREEVAAALAANSLILLKGDAADFPGYLEIYHLTWATNYPTQALVLQFGKIAEASLIYTTIVLVFSYQEGAGVSVMASSTKLATDEQVKAKQDKLVSGTNIKTINGESLMNGGDIKVGVPTIRAGRELNSEVFNEIDPGNAQGIASHAEGNNTRSIGFASHTEGNNTIALSRSSHAEGSYNVEDGVAIHQVGIGTSATRKDAHRITNDGKHYIIGIGGFDGTKRTETFTNVKDLATVINGYETRIAALETALAGIKSN